MESAKTAAAGMAQKVLQGAAPEDSVLLAWPLVCGSAVAQRVQAVEFAAGVLRVRVPDNDWKHQLEAFSDHYSSRLSQITGIKVEKIRYEASARR